MTKPVFIGGVEKRKKKEMLCSISGTFLIRFSAQLSLPLNWWFSADSLSPGLPLPSLGTFLGRTPFPWRWLNSYLLKVFYWHTYWRSFIKSNRSLFLNQFFSYIRMYPIIHSRLFQYFLYSHLPAWLDPSKSFRSLSDYRKSASFWGHRSTALSLLSRLCYRSCEDRIFKPCLMKNKRCIKSIREKVIRCCRDWELRNEWNVFTVSWKPQGCRENKLLWILMNSFFSNHGNKYY